MASASSDRVFTDRSLLDPDTIPAVFEHRDAERDALRTVLSPALWGSGPATALITGPPGAGKRTTVAVVTARTDTPGDRPAPRLVPVACTGEATAYDLAITTTNTLAGEDVLAASGYTREAAFGRLRDRIVDAAAPPVVRLDGVERLDPAELEGFLGGLCDESAACGVVAVADDRESLPRGVRERFHGAIDVAPYDTATERAILSDRAERAFTDGACPAATVERALDRADRGLRDALRLLDSAGDRVASAGRETVAPDDVDAADRTLREQRLRDRIDDRSRHERLTLAAVLDGDGAQRFADLYANYCDRCAAADVDPNRERSVHNYLDALVTSGLLTAERRRSPAAGTHFAYQAAVDRTVLRQSLVAVDDAVSRSERQ
ncbi:Cdc6/Cdc18 family protein [Halococcoides cellulosivorans]|uniref:Uncharacterized protein n=1 Tax=Halococcoides cellulosivorans TaxID=1679096 RepID=A0A2R4X371_9EURY|nr:hypothetical protein [Halococcoides cellulosivorans]AWB28237.1 hypothetical protein HARCEL1_11245 [Halococcoides cellulosivorans]